MATTEQVQQIPTQSPNAQSPTLQSPTLQSPTLQSPNAQSPKQLERRANAKEEIVNATSGAREIVDHAAFNARAVGKILLHPFDKEAKTGAIAKAREDKALSGQKMAAIREVGAQQADAMRASSRQLQAEPVTESPPQATDAAPASEVAAAPPPVRDAAIGRD